MVMGIVATNVVQIVVHTMSFVASAAPVLVIVATNVTVIVQHMELFLFKTVHFMNIGFIICSIYHND